MLNVRAMIHLVRGFNNYNYWTGELPKSSYQIVVGFDSKLEFLIQSECSNKNVLQPDEMALSRRNS